MNFPLLPMIVANKITDLTPAFLNERGVRLLMLDFDNTIVPYTTSIPTETVAAWLKEIQNSQIEICVVSNSRKPRVRLFCQAYDIPCITHARKPFGKGISQGLQKFGIEPAACALVGDQIFTDTLGANCAGIQSILVRAIDNHTIWLKLRHCLELPFIFAARNRRIQK